MGSQWREKRSDLVTTAILDCDCCCIVALYSSPWSCGRGRRERRNGRLKHLKTVDSVEPMLTLCMIDLIRVGLYFDGLEQDSWGFKRLHLASNHVPARLPIIIAAKHNLLMVTLHDTAQHGARL